MRLRHVVTQSKHAKLIKSAQMLAATTFCAVSAALAWFTYAQNAKTSGVEFGTVDAINTSIKVDKSDWNEHYATSVSIEDMQELSGLGYMKGTELMLWKPSKNPFTGAPIEAENGTWQMEKPVEKNMDYLEYDVTVKANLPGTVYLSPESQIAPVDPESRNNSFGNFSRDYIAAATRVSFSEITKSSVEEGSSTATETLRAIWAPNPEIELIAPVDQDTGTAMETAVNGWSLNTDAVTKQGYFYYDGTEVKEITSINEPINETESDISDENFAFYDDLTGQGMPIGVFYLDPSLESGQYYCHLKVRVWVEGCDREAKTPLTGGRFKIKLVFSSVADTNEPEPGSN